MDETNEEIKFKALNLKIGDNIFKRIEKHIEELGPKGLRDSLRLRIL